jgi:deoxyribose-phosphate aldolase
MNPADAPAMARRALGALDLTSLGDDDTPAHIEQLCAAAASAGGAPAAVCVYPEHIGTARRALDRLGLPQVRIATVTNFPDGSADEARAVRETRRAVAAGADEVDVVFPWRAFREGQHETAAHLVIACKAACGARPLKVILETGELGDPGLIRAAADCALEAGADFIKTSTGKVAVNATPAAARILLEAIRDHGGSAGFKAAGGVRTVADAAAYLTLADDILGPGWATPARFRLGASGLLADIRAVLGVDRAGAQPGAGY